AGVVRGAGDDRPVGEAMVVVTDIRGEVLATAKTGTDGEFTFQELATGIGGSSDGTATGQCTVAVNAPGFRPVARPVEIGTHGMTRLEITLQPGARVQGTVRAGAGRRPLADARVTLVDAAGNVVATSTTGEDGEYAFTDLDAGEYTVMASGYPPVANALTVNGSGVDGYDVELRHPDA
ncbi:MAG TPA: carboxypeptidase-like regulatory domain-containing protein, partial [Streptomyces sp.]|nr:carboxypeptidase-like regulatory domain-containing protein [Streptomyces sp.]